MGDEQLMGKPKEINYYVESDEPLHKGRSAIIKWYQVNMESEESAKSDDGESPAESDESGEEEIDLASTGLSEDDQALVLDIMARFADAHQDSVDSIVNAAVEEENSSAMSEEELIASICAPKQSNVDSLVRKAESMKE